MRRLLGLLFVLLAGSLSAAEFPLFTALTGENTPRLITYTPSQLDPRNAANNARLPTSSLRADLTALRTVFDGLVLYGYHEANTPRILAVAKELKFKVVLIGVWDIKNAGELDGAAALAKFHLDDFALGVLVGNEGITFNRYELEDLAIAAARMRKNLPPTVAIGTSEPLVGYKHDEVRTFGDFLAPNIHPVFDRKDFPPAEAAAWAREEALKLAKETKLPVILKETGFPHAGKPIYTPESQRAFWAAYVKPGLVVKTDAKSAWVYHGVAFEAFDLPWKSEESKLEIEKSWGLFSPKREAYPALEAWKR